MIAKLEFNLPEEREEFELCNKAVNYYSTLFAIFNELRTMRKHGHAIKTADEMLEHIWEFFHEKLEEKGIEL